MRRFIFSTIGLVLMFAVVFGGAEKAQAAERLSLQEVRDIFLGTPWHSDNGAFLFRTDGSYTYYDFGDKREGGPWTYSITDQGALIGATTRYTFFRRNNGRYIYHHSRSGKYYNAYPNKSYP